MDLLKRRNIEDDEANLYINVLEQKAGRLKTLTEDLLEASKISSGNLALNMERIDINELMKQCVGEFDNRFRELGLTIVMDASGKAAYINADSRRMWRVMDNLFNNICKYALENTRVFVDTECQDGNVHITFKNTSKQQLDVRGEELTERFIRGDSSRATEGSGLGLYIAKSLTEAQGGSFEIGLDGDLFKVFLTFPEYMTT